MRPFGQRVLVRRLQAKEKTEGGIIIPDGSKEKMGEGEVVGVGVDDEGCVLALGEGEVVIFSKHAGVEIDGLLILSASDILAVR